MEGADGARGLSDQCLDALTHLPGGFVGEGHGKNLAGPNALADEPSNAACDHASLAGAGTRNHNHRTVAVGDSFQLRNR